jgi:hypothetical protein
VPTVDESIWLYAQLAEDHQKQGRPQERDRFLLLAADAALSGGKRDVAENFRRTLLARNPNHLLKPYSSLSEALASPDIATYVQELRRTYPAERLERRTQGPLPGGTSLGQGKDAEPDLLLPLDAERRTKVAATYALQSEPSPRPVATAVPVRVSGVDAARAKPSQAGPAPFSLRPEPATPRPMPLLAQRQMPEASNAGGWFGAFLFFITLIGGLALLCHVFMRPFLHG